jgi:hypothetical protein
MFFVISVAPCEIVSSQLQLDSFVKMRVAQGNLVQQAGLLVIEPVGRENPAIFSGGAIPSTWG